MVEKDKSIRHVTSAASPSPRSPRSRRQDRRHRLHHVPDGVVFIPFAYVEAAANLLTNPKLDPFGKIPEFKFCAAKVERVEPVREAAE